MNTNQYLYATINKNEIVLNNDSISFSGTSLKDVTIDIDQNNNLTITGEEIVRIRHFGFSSLNIFIEDITDPKELPDAQYIQMDYKSIWDWITCKPKKPCVSGYYTTTFSNGIFTSKMSTWKIVYPNKKIQKSL